MIRSPIERYYNSGRIRRVSNSAHSGHLSVDSYRSVRLREASRNTESTVSSGRGTACLENSREVYYIAGAHDIVQRAFDPGLGHRMTFTSGALGNKPSAENAYPTCCCVEALRRRLIHRPEAAYRSLPPRKQTDARSITVEFVPEQRSLIAPSS